LLAFIADSPLVIHNAEFDVKFLNAEFARVERPALPMARSIDTIAIAKRRFPGARYSLDELCRRFDIDLSGREKHGARIDGELLAAVYLELIGGRQPVFDLAQTVVATVSKAVQRILRPARPHAPSTDELAAHATFLAKIKAPLWSS